MFQMNRSILRGWSSKTLLITTTRQIRGPFPKYKRSYEERNRMILNAHKSKRLVLADNTSKPQQWSVKPAPKEPKIIEQERKLRPLHEEAPPYQQYQVEGNSLKDEKDTYFDPLFNPHLHEERNRVDPEQEPFKSIYADSGSDDSCEFTKTRNITTPELWQYVEDLARLKIQPEPPRRKDGDPIAPLPSGIVPPPENPPDLDYFVPRTRNFLLPVYYKLNQEPEVSYTEVRQISGDLWKFEQDLRTHLESLHDKGRILTSVYETDGRVLFKGRYIHDVVSWLYAKGF